MVVLYMRLATPSGPAARTGKRKPEEKAAASIHSLIVSNNGAQCKARTVVAAFQSWWPASIRGGRSPDRATGL